MPPCVISDKSQQLPLSHVDAYRVIQKERRRQFLIEQGSLEETAQRTSPSTISGSAPTGSEKALDLPIPFQRQEGTPRQRFCLVDLVDDPDAVYGRIQWANASHDKMSSAVFERQQHADQLALRFLKYTAWNNLQHLVPLRSADHEPQSPDIEALDHSKRNF